MRLGPLASWALDLRGQVAELSHTRALAPGTQLTCSLSRSYPLAGTGTAAAAAAAAAAAGATTTALSAHLSSGGLDLRAGLKGVDRLSLLGVPVHERTGTLSASTELARLGGLKAGLATAHDLRDGGALRTYSAGCELGDPDRSGALSLTCGGVRLSPPSEYTLSAA